MTPHAVTAVATPQAVQCVQAVAGSEPFSMIDQQAGLVVKLAKMLGEVLQGKESAHSLRLHDLEQRREELQRRHRAAVIGMPEPCVGADELQWTLETLDRVAAGLFRTARRCHQVLPSSDEVTGEIVASIHKAAVSLRHGYARLANGSPAAEFDAEAAMASASPGRALRLCELHGNLNGIACELGRAAAILKRWSRQMAAGLPEATLRANAQTADFATVGGQLI
ncbi:MAG: hypothetical protein JNK92_11170 [Dechloromonas sp.]|nr:hypothetical protein [Dechloromonas sp.]